MDSLVTNSVPIFCGLLFNISEILNDVYNCEVHHSIISISVIIASFELISGLYSCLSLTTPFVTILC